MNVSGKGSWVFPVAETVGVVFWVAADLAVSVIRFGTKVLDIPW